MNPIVFAASLATLVGAALIPAAPQPAAPPPPPTVRVGVIDAPAVAVAYYRSQLLADDLKQLKREHEAARRAGDHDAAAALERRGAQMQDLAHKQAAGEAPLGPVADRLSAQFAAIARAEDLDLIVERVVHKTAGAQVIDVTERMLEALGADEKTRQVIEDLRKSGHAH